MTRSELLMAVVRGKAASLSDRRRAAWPARSMRQDSSPAPKARDQSRYMPALDGLRALAVLAVIAYHVNAGWASGGLLGVGVFFVLSGYLITDLLISQWDRLGHLDLKDFWGRRARRLLPALWTMLVVVTAYMSVFDRAQLGALRGDLLAAVLYVSNWWLTFHHVSYFASFGPPSPLEHLWSLAVEEQFYLLWPLILALGLRLLPGWRRRLAIGTLALAAASALAMALLYQPGMDPSRVYYGTDTRAFALLIGAALAMVWPSHSLGAAISRRNLLALDALGAMGLLAFLAMVYGTNEYQTFLYPVGLVLLSVASAVLIAALAHPQSRLARVIAWEPLRWLGVRSYAIYLWHYPVIALTTPLMDAGTFGPRRALLQVSASIILAALSWQFIEAPVRRGALTRLWQEVRAGWAGEIWRRMPSSQHAASMGAALVTLVALSGVAGLAPAAARPTQAAVGPPPTPPGTTVSARRTPLATTASLGPVPYASGGATTPASVAPGGATTSATKGQGGGTTTPATQGHGTTTPATQGHGTTTPTTQGHGTTTPATQGHGTTTPATQGHGTTTPATQGHGTTTPATQGHGTTTPATQGHGTTTPTTIVAAGFTTPVPIFPTGFTTAVSTTAPATPASSTTPVTIAPLGGPGPLPIGGAGQTAASAGSGRDGRSTASNESGGSPTASSTTPASGACTSVTAIGDSIMVDTKPYLQAMLPGAYIDGLVGRQLYQAQETVHQLQAEGHLGNCVIIELGTNGPFTKGQLVSLLQSLGHPRRIVLVNTRVPRPWQNVVNQTLAAVAASYPHVVLVNWFAASQNKGSYFWPDGVHLDPVGAKVYAGLIVKALEPTRSTPATNE